MVKRNPMSSVQLNNYFYWIKERHDIYRRRLTKPNDPPWTKDPILLKYKFTNPFRENDRTTVWMRKNWPKGGTRTPDDWGTIIYNTCLFRMFGTMDFAREVTWQTKWDPIHIKRTAMRMFGRKQKVFTGAYIVTNSGIKAPKHEVVTDNFLKPIWNSRAKLAAECLEGNSLQEFHAVLGEYPGWGGGGFMAYEVTCDLNHMVPLKNAFDRYLWANAGPGAKRGLNRLTGRELKFSPRNHPWNLAMVGLLAIAKESKALNKN